MLVTQSIVQCSVNQSITFYHYMYVSTIFLYTFYIWRRRNAVLNRKIYFYLLWRDQDKIKEGKEKAMANWPFSRLTSIPILTPKTLLQLINHLSILLFLCVWFLLLSTLHLYMHLHSILLIKVFPFLCINPLQY